MLFADPRDWAVAFREAIMQFEPGHRCVEQDGEMCCQVKVCPRHRGCVLAVYGNRQEHVRWHSAVPTEVAARLLERRSPGG
jgi:hypothetical protein